MQSFLNKAFEHAKLSLWTLYGSEIHQNKKGGRNTFLPWWGTAHNLLRHDNGLLVKTPKSRWRFFWGSVIVCLCSATVWMCLGGSKLLDSCLCSCCIPDCLHIPVLYHAVPWQYSPLHSNTFIDTYDHNTGLRSYSPTAALSNACRHTI